jgi:hypothetical protein
MDNVGSRYEWSSRYGKLHGFSASEFDRLYRLLERAERELSRLSKLMQIGREKRDPIVA